MHCIFLFSYLVCETDSGETYTDGQSWHPDDCTTCECHFGNTACFVQDCPKPECDNYQRVDGKCCPVCPSNYIYTNHFSINVLVLCFSL